MKKTLKAKEEEIKEALEALPVPSPELERLVTLLADLKAIGVNSIGDLEVKIARLQ